MTLPLVMMTSSTTVTRLARFAHFNRQHSPPFFLKKKIPSLSLQSYRDLLLRLEPIIMELERQTDILIIGHQAVLRAIFAYYMDYPLEDLPYIKVPLHTVIKFTPKAYKTTEERFPLNIEAVDTHRDRKVKKAKDGE